MKRKIYDEFLQWKREEKGKNALLIDGARRKKLYCRKICKGRI